MLCAVATVDCAVSALADLEVDVVVDADALVEAEVVASAAAVDALVELDAAVDELVDVLVSDTLLEAKAESGMRPITKTMLRRILRVLRSPLVLTMFLSPFTLCMPTQRARGYLSTYYGKGVSEKRHQPIFHVWLPVFHIHRVIAQKVRYLIDRTTQNVGNTTSYPCRKECGGAPHSAVENKGLQYSIGMTMRTKNKSPSME